MSDSKSTQFAQVEKRYIEDKKIWKVIVRFHGLPANTQEVTNYLTEVEKIYSKNEKFCMLYDASTIGIPNYAYVKQQIDFMRQKDDETKKLMICCAIIAPSSGLVNLINLIFLAKKPATEVKVCKSMSEAKDFFKSKLSLPML